MRLFGAIALSPSTLEYAIVNGELNQRDAESKALAACRAQNAQLAKRADPTLNPDVPDPAQPDDCKIGVWYRGGCGAYARENNGEVKAWATQYAETAQAAGARAILECNKNSPDKLCAIVAAQCVQ